MAGIRERRQGVMRELVRNEGIRTQAEFVERLGELGYEVTQATVSRDIADLELRKGNDGAYILPQDHRLRSLIASTVHETRRAGNQVLLLSGPGCASSIAAALDATQCDGMLGCIAGDDTVLVICADEKAGEEFQASIDAMLA